MGLLKYIFLSDRKYNVLLLFCFCLTWTYVAVAESQLLNDPTRPMTYVKSKNEQKIELRLQGVFIHEEGNQAIINGQLVKVGDAFQNLTITNIQAHKVFLKDGNHTRELQLRPRILSMPKSEG